MTDKEKFRRVRAQVGYWQDVAKELDIAVASLLLRAYKRGRADEREKQKEKV